MKKLSFILVAVILLLSGVLMAQDNAGAWRVSRNIPVGGSGGWDYLTVDQQGQRLFVSHSTCVEVVDLKSGKSLGQIPNTTGVHGIALVPALNKGFISAGRLDSVLVFDLKTLKVTGRVLTGANPDFIFYDPFSKNVFTFNGRGKSVTAIDAGSGKVAGTLPVSGKPEAGVSDGKGKIYCNIEDKGTIVKFDAVSLKIEAVWSLGPGREPTGLGLDVVNNRLFSACSGSNQLVVMDAANGHIVSVMPIGEGCDGLVWVPSEKIIATSNGEGTMTLVRQEGPDTYKVIQTLQTRKNARTITWDESSKQFYLPSAEVKMEDGIRSVVPGTFGITVVSR